MLSKLSGIVFFNFDITCAFRIEDYPTIMSSNNDLNISPSFAVNISPFSFSDTSSSSLLRSSELVCSSDVPCDRKFQTKKDISYSVKSFEITLRLKLFLKYLLKIPRLQGTL